jgi:hypothetical protein
MTIQPGCGVEQRVIVDPADQNHRDEAAHQPQHLGLFKTDKLGMQRG